MEDWAETDGLTPKALRGQPLPLLHTVEYLCCSFSRPPPAGPRLSGNTSGPGYSANETTHKHSILKSPWTPPKSQIQLLASTKFSCPVTFYHPTFSQQLSSKTNLRSTWMAHVFLKPASIIHLIAKLLVSTNSSQESDGIRKWTNTSRFYTVFHIINPTSPKALTQGIIMNVGFIS